MRLLVTGGSGYLGTEVVRQARAAGWKVVGTYFSRPVEELGALDVRDRPAVSRLLADVRPQVVIHAAYVQSGPESAARPLLKTKLRGVRAVLWPWSRSGLA